MNNPPNRPRLLLTNDDGYQAQGLELLHKALSQFFEVVICAPETNQSAQSHRITIRESIYTRSYEHGYIVSGSPVDAVHLALADLVRTDIDLVISGMNHGSNLGDDYHYSGTLAAAREAALYGYRAVALSMDNFDKTIAKEHANFIAKYLYQYWLDCPQGVLVSMNLPEHQTQNVQQTTLGSYERGLMSFEKFTSKRHQGQWYWIGRLERGKSEDFAIVQEGKISVTAIDYRENILGSYISLPFIEKS